MRLISTSPEAVAGRRAAIEVLHSRGLTNRDIARYLDCSIWTVRYWLNPKTRIHRIAYKAKARAA
jgi:DNA-binding CsgD family transcriptional regulator